MSEVTNDEAGNIHLHVYFPANKEGNGPQIGRGRLPNYPQVSGHTHEYLVKDSSNRWFLAVTSEDQNQVGSSILRSSY